VKIIPIVIGVLGTVPKGLIKGLKALEMSCALDLLQNACLLGSESSIKRTGWASFLRGNLINLKGIHSRRERLTFCL